MRIEKTFECALALLRHRAAKRSSDLPRRPQTATFPNGTPTFRGTPHIENMKAWLAKLGYDDSDVESLKIIHVAGTKGKGSTCAYTESFLRQHGKNAGVDIKTGLYTSPHLLDITERVRINSIPLAPEAFTRYFFDVWNRLDLQIDGPGPRQLQLLCLLSFHVFLQEKVDVAIYETHHGGEFDATNIISRPLVTAITSIGVDHVQELGPSIENIAWHKAGIFKPGTPAISCRQDSLEVERVLNDRAQEKNIGLTYIELNDELSDSMFPAKPQRINATLARAAADIFLRCTKASPLDKQDIAGGIANFHWPGRFELVSRPPLIWHLDGAHTVASAQEAAFWYSNSTSKFNIRKNIVIFGHNSDRHDRTGILRSLIEHIHLPITHVIFTSDTSDGRDDITTVEARLEEYRRIWQGRLPSTVIKKVASPENAMRVAEGIADGDVSSVLVTGSLYLVASGVRYLS